MVETVKIGNSWYVVEDICGIVEARPDAAPPMAARMLMRGGHILTMEGLSQQMIDRLCQLRNGKGVPGAFGEGPVQQAEPSGSKQQKWTEPSGKVVDVDMSPETVIDVPAEKPA